MKDVAILGGGLAGLSLALQLKKERPSLDVCVLEKASFPVAEATHKIGESTVELATQYFAQTLGLESHLKEKQLPKFGLRFFFGEGDIQNRLEVGGSALPPSPSYQLDRGRFENFLADCCREHGVTILEEAAVKSVDISENSAPHVVHYQLGGTDSSVESTWLVDASGRASLLKRHLDLRKSTEHEASAVWFRVNENIQIDEWSQDTKWRTGHQGSTSRWYSTNHLMGTGYWVWLIPLASGSTSVGIVVDQKIHPVRDLSTIEKSLHWLQEHEPQCALEILSRKEKIQDFGIVRNYTHDCQRVFSAKRWFLTGEAGVFLDPFYSPGSDFIALSNTFITDLIVSADKGANIRSKTRFFNNLYLSFFRNTLDIFENQYPIFGHPQIMPIKIVWDQAVYWALLAYLFFQQRITDPQAIGQVGDEITKIGKLNKTLQSLFRQAAKDVPEEQVANRIDFLSVKILLELNRDLGAKADFQETMRLNSERLEQLAAEITEVFIANGVQFSETFFDTVEPSHELDEFFCKLGLKSARGTLSR